MRSDDQTLDRYGSMRACPTLLALLLCATSGTCASPCGECSDCLIATEPLHAVEPVAALSLIVHLSRELTWEPAR